MFAPPYTMSVLPIMIYAIRIFGKVEGNIGKVEGDKKLGA